MEVASGIILIGIVVKILVDYLLQEVLRRLCVAMAPGSERVDTEVHIGQPDGCIVVWTDSSFSSEQAERKLGKLYHRAEIDCCEVLETVMNGQEGSYQQQGASSTIQPESSTVSPAAEMPTRRLDAAQYHREPAMMSRKSALGICSMKRHCGARHNMAPGRLQDLHHRFDSGRRLQLLFCSWALSLVRSPTSPW
jgi:hypothetical protein